MTPESSGSTRINRSQPPQVAVTYHDDLDETASLHYEVAECVETKVVTTTTTTKRAYPPFLLRNRRPLGRLDAKEYPLAQKPTPPELASFTLGSGETGSARSSLDIYSDHEGRHSPRSGRDHESRHRQPRLLPSPTRIRTPGRRVSQPDPAYPFPPTRTVHGNRHVSTVPSQHEHGIEYLATPDITEGDALYTGPVATPPLTDADALPFDVVDAALQHSIHASYTARPSVEALHEQDACLPSPRLSPTLGATRRLSTDSNEVTDDVCLARGMLGGQSGLRDDSSKSGLDWHTASLLDTRTILQSFDTMPDQMRNFLMYQMMRRSSRKTLRLVVDVVDRALKCDFLVQLPAELGFHVLSHLGHKDLCRAAQVSKHWRNMIDSNETGWKELFDRDGFELSSSELEKAIKQGWGWQDPVGAEGCEVDLRKPEQQLVAETESVPSRPRMKRKRGLYLGPEGRSKRRASGQDTGKDFVTRFHRSEGPISAANAAAAALPNPELGLSSLRKLHLFKSLYRRHHMIRQNWTSDKVKPSHVAFAAHPRHVITCLQFDDDKIITGSDDTLINVYDTRTGKLKCSLEGHEGGVWALQYEGNTLVSGSTDRSVRVWDIEKGMCTQVFQGHTSTVRCLQILMPVDTGVVRDGRPVIMPQKPLIITGSRDAQLRVWRLPEPGARRFMQNAPATHEPECPYFVRTLQGHQLSVRSIAAHGDTLVSGSYDCHVRVWKISTGETVHVLVGHSQKVYSVVLDHKRDRCISGSMDSLVKIWDLKTGANLFTLEGHLLLVGLLDLKDERLVSAAADASLRVWDPENGRCKHTLMAHSGAITCFQHDGRKIVSGSEKSVKMWDMQTGDLVQDLLSDLGGVWQVKFDARRCVAAVQRDNLTYIEILDFGAVRDGKPVSDLGIRQLLNPEEVKRLVEEVP